MNDYWMSGETVGAPGEGPNGSGADGYYYDYISGTYRCTNTMGWASYSDVSSMIHGLPGIQSISGDEIRDYLRNNAESNNINEEVDNSCPVPPPAPTAPQAAQNVGHCAPPEKGGNVDFGNYKISSTELKKRLEEFADQTGYNVTVVGGDRDASKNAAVGGSKGSRHINGDAADIVVRGVSNRDISIQAHNSNLFNTTIYYPNYNTPGALPPHVHVDLNPRNDNILLIYERVDRSNKYIPWNP